MRRGRRRLRHRLMLAFAAFTALTAALFGFYGVVFMYATEDAFFDGLLRQEATVQQEARAHSGTWSTPRLPFVRVYANGEVLPDGLAARLAAEPQRHEFSAAEGRHYHVLPLSAGGAEAWLVAEVSGQLVVRPLRERVLAWLAWSALVLIGVALLLGFWLAHRVAAPLAKLAERVDRLTPPLAPDFAAGFGDDEVGTLAQALQDLAARLHGYVAREREFTRDASHELRTPLTVIRAAAERLEHEPLSAQGREQLSHLQASVRALQQTMDALLALARAEAVTAASAPLRVAAMVESVVLEQAVLLGNRPVEVDVEIDAGATTTLPGPVLRILLANLIGNAFEHTGAGRVAIRLHGARLHIVNREHAVARAEADIDRTANAARAADEAALPVRREGGGLGLGIVQRLAARYDLDLRLELTRDGADASFGLGPG